MSQVIISLSLGHFEVLWSLSLIIFATTMCGRGGGVHYLSSPQPCVGGGGYITKYLNFSLEPEISLKIYNGNSLNRQFEETKQEWI